MAATCVGPELIKLDLGSHLGGKPLIKTNPLAVAAVGRGLRSEYATAASGACAAHSGN